MLSSKANPSIKRHMMALGALYMTHWYTVMHETKITVRFSHTASLGSNDSQLGSHCLGCFKWTLISDAI